MGESVGKIKVFGVWLKTWHLYLIVPLLGLLLVGCAAGLLVVGGALMSGSSGINSTSSGSSGLKSITGQGFSQGSENSIAPVGNDHAEVGQTQIRFGHLRLLNAYGSELLPLRVEYRAEYWDGNRWRTNTEDNCSGITADNVAKRAALPVPAISALSNGVGFITFAPTAVGAYDIALNLGSAANDASCNAVALPASTGANLSWLQGNWCGVAGYVRDPNARIKLGSPKAPYIYLRERY